MVNMNKKSRWRKIQRLVKHEVSIDIAKLEVLELYHMVGFGSCDYREDVILKSLTQSFEILKRAIPKYLLVSAMYSRYHYNPEFYDMQDRLELWFEQVIPAELYEDAFIYAVDNGYIAKGFGIEKCPYCESKEIIKLNTYYDEFIPIEGVFGCENCARDLCTWEYGDIALLEFLDKLIELKGW